MLQAYLTCVKQINKKDKMVKFDKKYSDLFKKNKNQEKVFSYNLYLEKNLDKVSSKSYLRENLFQNPCIIKVKKFKYLETESLVTIYYDKFTDLFAILDLKKNCLFNFSIATEIK